MEMPKIEKKKLLLLVGLIVVILLGFSFQYGRVLGQQQRDDALLLGQPEADLGDVAIADEPEPIPEPEPPLLLAVHVKGAVAEPGLFELAPGSRVADAVAAAGLLEEANIDLINLAFVLVDGMEVIVPFQVAGEETNWDALLQGSAIVSGAGANPAAAGAGSSGGSAGSSAPFTGIVNINTDGMSRLQSLPGIGAVRAQAIIDFREANGPFARIEDITRVSGIGPGILENIRSRISVD